MIFQAIAAQDQAWLDRASRGLLSSLYQHPHVLITSGRPGLLWPYVRWRVLWTSVISTLVCSCSAGDPQFGINIGTGTSNVTYFVECDRAEEVAFVKDKDNTLLFAGYNFHPHIVGFAASTLGGKSDGTVFEQFVAIETDDATGVSNVYSVGDYVNRADIEALHALVQPQLISSLRPLIGVLVAAYDQAASYWDWYKFPDSYNAPMFPALGETYVTYGAEDDGDCPCVSTGTIVVSYIYAGTCVKFGKDTYSYVKTNKSNLEIEELVDTGRMMDHVLAHELSHAFGIEDAFDTIHQGSSEWCVMNLPPGAAAFVGKVNAIETTNPESIRAFETWVTNAVYALPLKKSHGHTRHCTYPQVVAFYDTTKTTQ